MSIARSFLPEFDQEMEATRKVLERVPDDKFEWRPHEKSMTLHDLAIHTANLLSWTEITLKQDAFDMAPPGGEEWKPPTVTSTSDLLGMFDQHSASAREAIASTSDQEFMRSWALKKGGEEIFSAPKVGVLRRFVMNHMIHHRGQLTVYLRLNEVPVPQTVGPTADEPDF